MSDSQPHTVWELSDSDDDEDIFQLDIQASVKLDEEEPVEEPNNEPVPPPQSTVPTSRNHLNENGNGVVPPGRQNGFSHRSSSPQPEAAPPPRRRRGGRQNYFMQDDMDDTGFDREQSNIDAEFDPSKYTMPFPTNPPYCAWFGNVVNHPTVDDDLYEYFGDFGLNPLEIRFGKPGIHGQTCCFVDFETADDLKTALVEIDRPSAPRFYDVKLQVDIAEPRPSIRYGGNRSKRRGRHPSAPMSIGNDEYHPHVNTRPRRRSANSPRGRGGDSYSRRRGGRGRPSLSMQDRRRDAPPRRAMSRTASSDSSIHDDPDSNYERRRSHDRDSYKVNGSTRDRYQPANNVRSVRPSGPPRNRSRHEYDETPRRVRHNSRQQRRAHPRENFNHTKRPPSSRSSGHKRARGRGKVVGNGNSRFSNMFG